jgi:hypothetical protein
VITSASTCVWPICSTPAEPYTFGAPVCGPHWELMPLDLQRQLTAWYGIDSNGAGYHSTVARLRSWVAATFGGEEDRRDPGKWERLVRFVSERDERRRARALVPAEHVVRDEEPR